MGSIGVVFHSSSSSSPSRLLESCKQSLHKGLHRENARARFCRTDFLVYDGRRFSSNNAGSLFAACTTHSGNYSADPGHNNSVRIYVDAAYSTVICTYGLVVVDMFGNFIEASSGTCLVYRLFKRNSKHCWRLCFTSASLYTDFLLAMKYLNSESSSWPWSTILSLNACTILWNQLGTSITHISRNDNFMAHILAQNVDPSEDETLWLTHPQCLHAFFSNADADLSS